MIIHRMSTQTPEPPVRFYKVIALSFLLLTVGLLAVVIFVTSKKATIVVLAKQDTESVSISATVSPSSKSGNYLEGVVTSSEFVWSEKFFPTGNKKIEGIAEGEVILYNKTGAPITLVKTTRLLSSKNVLFRLSNYVVVPANGEVKAKVYADKKGAEGDIEASDFSIPGLPAEKQKVIYAKSAEPMKGGSRTVGVLSAEDIADAEEDYKEKASEAFKARMADSDGVERIVKVGEAKLVTDQKAGDEVTEFTVTGTSTIVIIAYKNADLKKILDRETGGKVDTSAEKVLSLTNKPVVTVQNFDLDEETATLNIRQDVAVTLDANINKLAPENFYGKKKEEIERYILSLDHVAGVDVKFSPSWVFSAPTVSDRISIVVKNIK